MSWNTCQYTECESWSARPDGDYCETHRRSQAKEVEVEIKAKQKRKALLSQPTAPRAKPNKVSAKRKEQNVEYFKLVEQFKKDNPECKAKVNEYCTGTTDDPHHSKGRGKYLLDIDTWIPCCRSCHTWIHDNTSEAKEKGLIFSRLATVKQTV